MKLYKGDRVMHSCDKDQLDIVLAAGWSRTKPEEEVVKVPEVKVPEIKEPEVKEPEVKEPEVKVPEIKEPEVKVTEEAPIPKPKKLIRKKTT